VFYLRIVLQLDGEEGLLMLLINFYYSLLILFIRLCNQLPLLVDK
jgi:hypothetical protein